MADLGVESPVPVTAYESELDQRARAVAVSDRVVENRVDDVWEAVIGYCHGV